MILAVIALAATAADAQVQTPNVLLVVREHVRPDSAKVYAKNESEIAGICARLKCPHPYLALASLYGPREVWWLNVFESQQDKERVDRAWAGNATLMAQLRPLGKRKEQLRQGLTTTLATYRPDLSTGVILRINGARFFVITVRHDRHNADGAVFESPDGQYFAITPAETRDVADRAAARAGAGSRILAVQPQWSFPADSWIAADPVFWKDNPAARSRSRS